MIASDLLTAIVGSYDSKSITDGFFFSCRRFSTLAKMVLRSQCLLFTRKELNWMVLILPSCTDMEASTYQLHQATGKQCNLHLLWKHQLLTAVTDWVQGELWIWLSGPFRVAEKQDGGQEDRALVSRHSVAALLVLNQRGLPRDMEEICVRAEKYFALEIYNSHPALWIIPWTTLPALSLSSTEELMDVH